MHERVVNEFERQADKPPAGDERIAAFSRAVLHIVHSGQEHPAVNILAQEHRHDRTPSYIANIALRAVQRQLMEQHDEYPIPFAHDARWRTSLSHMNDNQHMLDLLHEDIEHRNVQSNVTERYKAFKLVMQLLSSRIGESPAVIDIGCSRNLGLKKLRLNLPFNDIELDRAYPEADRIDLRSTRHIKELLAAPLALRQSTGVDIEPIDADRSWPRSCSFYPSELLDTARVEEYDYLDQADVSGVSFKAADITDQSQFDPDAGTFDVVTASTFLYQLNPEQRDAARSVMRTLLQPEGVIIYQDFAKPGNNGQLEFEDNWFGQPYPYRTLVEFADDPAHTCHEVLRWQNGRCKKWIPGRDIDLILPNAHALL